MSQDLANVKSTVKAVLTSTSTALGLNELLRDYKNLDGSELPFREFGHSNVLTFLKTIPDTVRLSNPESYSTLIFPVLDAKTAHINELVTRQKKCTKPVRRPNRGPPRSRFHNFPSRPPPRPQRSLPNEEPISDDFRRDVLKILENKPEGLPHTEFMYQVHRVSYNHLMTTPSHVLEQDLDKFIDVRNGRVFLRKDNPIGKRNGVVPHQPPNRPSHHDNLEFSASGSEDDYEDDFDTYSHNSDMSDEHDAENVSHAKPNLTNGDHAQPNSNSIDDTLFESVPPRIVKNITTLIQADENRKGIWLHDFLQKYLMKFNQELDLEACGCDEVLELVGKLKHVIHRKRYHTEGDHLLLDARQVQQETDVKEETGNIPSSFIHNLKKILSKRTRESLNSHDLPAEYKKYTGCTLDLKELGFSSMDSFLRSLEESCSDFCFMRVKDRILLRLNSIQSQERSTKNTNEHILPNGPSFSPFPAEVCNADSKLPLDPLFESLRKDDVFSAAIAEVYTPWRFFIHHTDNLLPLNRMMDDLNVFYIENEKEYEVLPMTVVKGLLCACTYSADNRWHRVSIISTKLKTAKVKFVDYGTMEEVNVNRLRYLHRKFADDHAMSVRAKLYGVQPKNIVDLEAKTEYSSKLNNLFYKLVSTVRLDATFISFDAKQDSYEISLLCVPDKEPPFPLSDWLVNENWVDVKVEKFAELPATDNSTPSVFFTPESLRPAKNTEPSHSKAEYSETAEKPTDTSAIPPVAPAVSHPPPQPPPPQKGPPPGLSLPTGTQSQNYNNLFSPLLISNNEASNVSGSKKKSKRNKNAGLYGSPLIAQPSMLNPPFGPPPMNVPPAYMTGLSCATSFDPLLVGPTLPPFGLPPSLSSSYASAPFPQYPSPYFYNYPYPTPPARPASPNPFTQFAQRPPHRHVRPPPGFSPLNFAPPPSYASPCGPTGFVPAAPATGPSATMYDRPNYSYEPLVTLATTANASATKSTTANTVEWPLKDPELASQWEKKRSESIKSEDNGCRKNSTENKTVPSSAKPTEESVLAGIDDLKLDAAPNSSYEDLIEIEKARERRGAESALKKCFNFSHSSDAIENVRTFLEAQAKPPTASPERATAAPAAPSPIADAEPAADLWEPKPRSQDDLALKLNAVMAKLAEASASNARTPSPVGASTPTSREANLAGAPETSSTDTTSACSGASSKASKKPCKLDSIKQMVMQNRK